VQCYGAGLDVGTGGHFGGISDENINLTVVAFFPQPGAIIFPFVDKSDAVFVPTFIGLFLLDRFVYRKGAVRLSGASIAKDNLHPTFICYAFTMLLKVFSVSSGVPFF